MESNNELYQIIDEIVEKNQTDIRGQIDLMVAILRIVAQLPNLPLFTELGRYMANKLSPVARFSLQDRARRVLLNSYLPKVMTYEDYDYMLQQTFKNQERRELVNEYLNKMGSLFDDEPGLSAIINALFEVLKAWKKEECRV